MSSSTFLFTSEAVTCGHPDKLCDLISDSILDAYLEQDPHAKVACETATKGNQVILLGEITSTATVNHEAVIRNAIRHVGFVKGPTEIDPDNCGVTILLEGQDPEIAAAVHQDKPLEDLRAGDQGLIFGYATDETPELMPFTHLLALRLCTALTKARKSNPPLIPWLRPDGKTQVTAQYRMKGGVMEVLRVDTILISTQHEAGIAHDTIVHEITDKVIRPLFVGTPYAKLLTDKTKLVINPSGSFLTGGPRGDAGMTGRKIVVDTYGGHVPHGGGAFSGKDPTKVDRSAAYAARWVAKSVVAAGLANRCQVQVAYGIGLKDPLSIHVDTFGTSKYSDEAILQVILRNFDLSPGGIIKALQLLKPIYREAAAGGHFGRTPTGPYFLWEQPKSLDLSFLEK